MSYCRELLRETGWASVQGITRIDDLVDIARSLGRPIPGRGEVVRRLTPTPASAARRGTFSARFGEGAFPAHTDTAFWGTPARYLVMYVTGDTRRHTTLLPFQSVCDAITADLRKELRRSVWVTSPSSGGIYCSMRFMVGGRSGWRWDSNVMRPANDAAHRLIDHLDPIIMTLPNTCFMWKPGTVLVVDNWRMLHGRAQRPDAEAQRELYRVYVA